MSFILLALERGGTFYEWRTRGWVVLLRIFPVNTFFRRSFDDRETIKPKDCSLNRARPTRYRSFVVSSYRAQKGKWRLKWERLITCVIVVTTAFLIVINFLPDSILHTKIRFKRFIHYLNARNTNIKIKIIFHRFKYVL